MGFFNFVENFFLISLGITFVLILLLVYHFKQRVSSMERKGDTMFELMRNMVNEINILKRVNSYFGNGTEEVPVLPAEITVVNPPTANCLTSSPDNNSQNVSHCEDNHAEDEDDDCETDEDYSDEEECGETDNLGEDDVSINSNDSSEDEYAGEDEIPIHHLVIEEIQTFEPMELESEDLNDLEVLEVNNFEPSVVVSSQPEEETLIVSEEFPSEIAIHLEEEEKPAHAPVNLEVEDVAEVSQIESATNNTEDTVEVVSEVREEETHLAETESSQPVEEEEQVRKESYRKMNLHQLKAVVQTLGIQTDVNKMKKNEILKLLNV